MANPGNFTPTATLNFIPDTVNTYNMYYFYFDDVCVVEMYGVPASFQVYDSSLCNGRNISINGREITYSGYDNCILAPRAFSPNGDGLNDNYTILVDCLMKSYTLKIYNRWGQLVYQSYNPEESWNGQVNGAPAETGVHFYYLKAVPFMDIIGKIDRKGDITLIR